MKFALLTVSYSGLFYAGKALSLEEQIRKAKQLGFDALAIETKRPVASPIDLNKADRIRIKTIAADSGIDLCAVESMSNFTSRYMEESPWLPLALLVVAAVIAWARRSSNSILADILRR